MGSSWEIDETIEASSFYVQMPEGYEEKLVERLKKRDESAFTELMELYQVKVFHLLFRMLGDKEEARDLAQDVFYTVFKSIDGFRGDSKLSTWIYRVAANHCKNRIKYLGRRARGQKQEFNELSEQDSMESSTMHTSSKIDRPDHVVEGMETESIVQRALAALDEEHRTLVVMRDIEGLSYEEIQVVTGLAEGTVKSRLHRARLALKELVEAEYKGKP